MATAAGLLAALYLVAVLLVWAFQRRLIYLHGPRPPLPHARPAGAEDVTLQTGDGLSLAAWFLRARREPPLATVLLCDGNAGDRGDRTPLAEALAAEGLQVLLFDYRGYGGNPGSPSEPGLIADARAALGHLRGRRDVDPQRIVYLGESLGAAVAIALSGEAPPAALVLRSPFSSMAEVARYHYPWLPVGLLLRDRWPSRDRMATLRCPVLVAAGDGDQTVPYAHSVRLYEAAPEPRRFVRFPGADHSHPELVMGPRLVVAIGAFLREHLPARPR